MKACGSLCATFGFLRPKRKESHLDVVALEGLQFRAQQPIRPEAVWELRL